jgi:hypothetical protein
VRSGITGCVGTRLVAVASVFALLALLLAAVACGRPPLPTRAPIAAPTASATPTVPGNAPLPTSVAEPGIERPAPGSRPSPAAQTVRARLAQRIGVPETEVAISTDHPWEYFDLGRQLQLVVVWHRSGGTLNAAVDLITGEIDEEPWKLESAEFQMKQARLAKYDNALHARLESAGSDEPLLVWIFLARPGLLPSFEETGAAAQPLIDELRARGLTADLVSSYRPWSTVVATTITPPLIAELTTRSEVGSVRFRGVVPPRAPAVPASG